MSNNVIRCGKIKYIKEKHTKAAMIAISDTKGQRNEHKIYATYMKKRLDF